MSETKMAIPLPWLQQMRRQTHQRANVVGQWLRGGGCEPINWRCRIYSGWYRSTSKLMHHYGWHRWRRRLIGDVYCSWCGDTRSRWPNG